MKQSVINIDPEILGGTPVFRGTRVPIKFLFDYLEGEESIETFIEHYPTVTKEQITEVLHLAGELITSEKEAASH